MAITVHMISSGAAFSLIGRLPTSRGCLELEYAYCCLDLLSLALRAPHLGVIERVARRHWWRLVHARPELPPDGAEIHDCARSRCISVKILALAALV